MDERDSDRRNDTILIGISMALSDQFTGARCKAWAVLIVALFLHQSALAAIDVTDDLGEPLRLDKPATRIVSLAPHITELLFAAGAGPHVVGVVSHSDYPAAALKIPQVGSYKTVSEESLVALRPDLIVAWHSGNGPEVIQRMRHLGFKVYVNEPRVLDDVANSLKTLGLLGGSAAQGAAASESFLKVYRALQSRYEIRQVVSVFYQVWDEPLTTLNGTHLISDVIKLCGGRNVFADAIPIAPRISVESVLRSDPDVIVASGMGESRPDWLDAWYDWPSMRAVQRNRLFFVPPDLLQRHTPRILEGAKQLCELLDTARSE